MSELKMKNRLAKRGLSFWKKGRESVYFFYNKTGQYIEFDSIEQAYTNNCL